MTNLSFIGSTTSVKKTSPQFPQRLDMKWTGSKQKETAGVFVVPLGDSEMTLD